jgi:hypothetical protein
MCPERLPVEFKWGDGGHLLGIHCNRVVVLFGSMLLVSLAGLIGVLWGSSRESTIRTGIDLH